MLSSRMLEHRLFTGPPRKILIIKPSSLGDIVHSLPVLNVLYRSFPEAEIHWLVAKGFEGVLEGHPMIGRLWIIRKDDWKRITKIGTTIRELRKLFRDLKAERFDCVIDLQGLFRSGLISKATGAPLRIGFKEAREGSTVFYTHLVEGGKDTHAVDRYLRTAAFLGCDISDVGFPFPPIGGSCRDLPVQGDYAVMIPGARKPANRWPARRFGGLASLLPTATVVIGSRGDIPTADEVVRASKGKAVSVAGKTDMKEMVGIISRAKFIVSNDTGPMHVGAAFGIPVFALFGPANPARTGPYGKGHVVIRKDLSCSPCYSRVCKSVKCLDIIKVQDVAAIIGDFLRGGIEK